MQHLKDAISMVTKFKTELSNKLAQTPELQLRATAVLTTLENGFRGIVGMDVVSNAGTVQESSGFSGKPHEDFMGVKTKPAPIDVEDLAPADDVIAKLKAEVNEAYDTFRDRDNEAILKTVDPLVIRGVAKKAGVEGFADTHLDSAFIDEIKMAMIDKDLVDQAKASGTKSEATTPAAEATATKAPAAEAPAAPAEEATTKSTTSKAGKK